jgi:hypothetical protein
VFLVGQRVSRRAVKTVSHRAGHSRLSMSVRRFARVFLVIFAGVVARNVLEHAWQRTTREPPPKDPTDRSVTWTRSLVWAAGVGAAVGVARAVARRGSSALDLD